MLDKRLIRHRCKCPLCDKNLYSELLVTKNEYRIRGEFVREKNRLYLANSLLDHMLKNHIDIKVEETEVV